MRSSVVDFTKFGFGVVQITSPVTFLAIVVFVLLCVDLAAEQTTLLLGLTSICDR